MRQRASGLGMDRPAGTLRLPASLPARYGLLIGAMLLPGIALALVLGGIVERWPSDGTKGSWLIAEVNRERSFSQSFVVTHDRLAGVELQLFRSGLNPQIADADVVVRLRATLKPGPDLAIATMRVGDLNSQGASEFHFRNFTYSPVFPADVVSTTLYMVVEAPSLPPGSGLMIAGTSHNYYDGVLRIGDRRFTRFDLAFTPIYTSLLGDRLLPLSRLAQGRPGPLGWPPFYILLGYSYLLAAAAALWRLSRSLRQR